MLNFVSLLKGDGGGLVRALVTGILAGSYTLSAISAASATTIGPAVGKPHHTPVGAFQRAGSAVSIISQLHTVKRIAISQDTANGDQNPYGLAYVPESKGVLEKGDLLVCNFNDNFNIQGLGTTIEYIRPSEAHPVAHRFVQDGRITGCEALSILPNDQFLLDATYANLEWELGATGIGSGINLNPPNNWAFPWSTVYTGNRSVSGGIALGYVTQQDGTLWRINQSGTTYTYDMVASGFFVNHGVAPTTLAVSGLSWDTVHGILYFLEGDTNSLIAIDHPERIPANGIVRTATGFSGPYASSAHVLATGGYINAPISTAVLFNGDIVVENTGDNNLLEFTPAGQFLGRRLLDGGGPGALFGIVAVGASLDDLVIYYNDDNENSLRSFSK
jgi:hypothetical protein